MGCGVAFGLRRTNRGPTATSKSRRLPALPQPWCSRNHRPGMRVVAELGRSIDDTRARRHACLLRASLAMPLVPAPTWAGWRTKTGAAIAERADAETWWRHGQMGLSSPDGHARQVWLRNGWNVQLLTALWLALAAARVETARGEPFDVRRPSSSRAWLGSGARPTQTGKAAAQNPTKIRCQSRISPAAAVSLPASLRLPHLASEARHSFPSRNGKLSVRRIRWRGLITC